MPNSQILKGTEPLFFDGNEIGVLVIHGFTGSTQSMRFLSEKLAEEGFTVITPRLRGHGVSPYALEKYDYQEWIEDVENAYKKLQSLTDKIFIIGLSMGGMLTLYLAEHHQNIAGIIPVNAAIDIPEFAHFFHEYSQKSLQFIEGIGSDIKKEGVVELDYSKTPIKSCGDLIKLMKIVRNNLVDVHTPTLIFSSIVDHVVPPSNSDEIFDTISSEDKEIIKLKESYHVATLDNDKELIVQKTIEFIRGHI